MSKIKMRKGKNENLAMDKVFERFLKHCRSKNLSEQTIEYYEENYDQFKNILVKMADFQKQDTILIKDINPQIFENYRLGLLERDISHKTVNSYIRAVRAFLYYAMRLDYLDDFKVQLIKTEKKIKITYTDSELERLLEKPDINQCSFSEYRNWVIVNWLMGTGNRARTLRNIKIEDIDLSDGYVTLRKVKNKKQQVIPLSKKLNKIIMEYLNYREGEKDDYLFCTIYGDKLSQEALKSAIYRYNTRRNVDKTSTHLFRHTFAKLWIKNGGDIFRLQKILGHKSMDMVREYVNMFGEDLKENFEEFNPINQFKNGNNESIKMR